MLSKKVFSFLFVIYTFLNLFSNTQISDLNVLNEEVNQRKYNYYQKDLNTSCIGKIRQDVSDLRDRHPVWPYFTSVLVANERNHPELHAIIENLCNKLNMTKPLVLVYVGNKIIDFIEDSAGGFLGDMKINAFATGGVIPKLNQTVGIIAIGLDLVENMNKDELEAIIAHEL
ncbi:MAG: M48 family metalloprotease [bacterium]